MKEMNINSTLNAPVFPYAGAINQTLFFLSNLGKFTNEAETIVRTDLPAQPPHPRIPTPLGSFWMIIQSTIKFYIRHSWPRRLDSADNQC